MGSWGHGIVRGAVLPAGVHFDRVSWGKSRKGCLDTAAAVSFFEGESIRLETSVEGLRLIAGNVAMGREARFEHAVVAFRRRRFFDCDDVGDNRSLIGAGCPVIATGRELSVMTKQL